MRKMLIALAASLAVSTSAIAADLPVKAAPYPVQPTDMWTSYYLGVSAGYGWGVADAGSMFSLSPKGTVLGIRFGHDWLVGSLVGSGVVVGIVGDVGWLGNIHQNLPKSTVEDKFSLDGSVRAKAGVLFSPNWLLYATGGLAVAKTDLSSLTRSTIGLSDTKLGWTAGGGTQYHFNRNWSVGAEVLYADYGKGLIETKTTMTKAQGYLQYHF